MKVLPLSSNLLIVRDPDAARLLADPRASRFLEPFIGFERTASAVAAELGVRVSSMLYRINQSLELGLLHVSRVEPRQGRALKYYRAVADSFYVPFELTNAETFGVLGAGVGAEMSRWLEVSLSAGHEEVHHAFGGWGVGMRLMRDQEGRLDRSLVPEGKLTSSFSLAELPLSARAPVLWDQHCLLDLTEDEAKALQRELSEVYGRYLHSDETDRQPYVVRLAMAPLKRS